MTNFKIQPKANADGSFAAAWFDDNSFLWNDVRLASAVSLAGNWTAPTLKLHRAAEGATAVLFNPNAIAVSSGVKEALASFPEIEFLPVLIDGQGLFHILHITAAVELPFGSNARIASPPSDNIVRIDGFPQAFRSGQAFFRVLHPLGSAARRDGKVTREIYVNIDGARAIQTYASGYLAAFEVPKV